MLRHKTNKDTLNKDRQNRHGCQGRTLTNVEKSATLSHPGTSNQFSSTGHSAEQITWFDSLWSRLRLWKSIKSAWMRHVEQFGVSMIFKAYESKLYLIKNTLNTVIKYFYNKKIQLIFIFNILLKCHLFLWCKTNISASLLQSSVSHDPSDVIIYFIYWLGAQEIFLIIKKVKINSIYWKWKSFVTL